MKLFTTEDIRKIDRATIEDDGVPARDLIERVAEGVAAEVMARHRASTPITVFAGPGNNGADALATAILLIEQGFDPEIFLLNIHGNSLSRDCRFFRDKLAAMPSARFTEIIDSMDHPTLTERHCIIDGLFGSGLRGNLTGGFMVLVRMINESGADVVSIDVPSGLFGDWNPTTITRNVVHATLTVAIQFPRLAFMFADNADLIGQVKVIDIGLSRKAADATPTKFFLVETNDVKPLLPPRKPFTSKADYGHAMIVAGQYGMVGAACMAADGAIRAGVGKLTVHAPRCAFNILQTKVVEALFEPDKHDIVVSEIPVGKPFDAVAIGPGLGTHDMTVTALENFLKKHRVPTVVDADALNAIARRPGLMSHIAPGSVLTPHAAEFDRIFGEQPSHEARLIKAQEMARKYSVVILLKGHRSAVVTPDGQVCFNSTGNPAMATAGSGDVLTGIIVALMAQGLDGHRAAVAGAFLHGLAGDIAAAKIGPIGVTASDIARHIPLAYKAIQQ